MDAVGIFRIQVLVGVSSITALLGAAIGSLSLVLAIPGIHQYDLIISLVLGLILLLFAALPPLMLQVLEFALDNLFALVGVGIINSIGAWYLADSIIAWSCLTFGASMLSVQGYRFFDAVAGIGVVAGWAVALINLIHARFYIPKWF